ncbi:DUF397 domain-containing protein [Longimycelium tulufanense]|uniref:DUF397 domain-containing protein n=1 Tax=Longimycelium tulufanense TaxID=907463 RepID=UPI001664E2FD|nr:DUF397 domain-containing protein [Longimycelium tulufanense]
MSDLPGLWRKSSHSQSGGECVEVANLCPATAVRDSKESTGPVLLLSRSAWSSFVSSLKSGRLDRHHPTG